MLVSILIFLGCVIAMAFGLAAAKRRGTVNISFGLGYFGLNRKPDFTHQTNREGMELVLSRFVEHDIYDMLWVSRKEDRYGGLMVTYLHDDVTLRVSFKTRSQANQIEDFRRETETSGYPCEESSDGFNGGFGEEFRETNFEFTLPKDMAIIHTFLDVVLLQLFDTEDTYFVSASRFSNGPRKLPAVGIKVSPKEDPLDGILKE